MLGNPRFVLLDQPTLGLDPSEKRKVWQYLLNLKKTTSILLISQDMHEIEVLCDKVSVMIDGKIHETMSPSGLKAKHGIGATF
jgi:ABC-type multidrug transport system ATPase subunit